LLFSRAMNARLPLLLLTALSVTTCAPRDPSGPPGYPSIDFPDLLPQQDVYSLQSYSGMGSKRGMIITDSAALQAAWDTVFVNYAVGQKPVLPRIDFGQNVVLLASAGPTPTQLLWFRITKVRERPEHLAVLVESEWPRCGGLPVTTNPVHIVMVPRVATQAVFEFVDNTEPCS
jgi:hypothetical protein